LPANISILCSASWKKSDSGGMRPIQAMRN
jgi:hypothetical protein